MLRNAAIVLTLLVAAMGAQAQAENLPKVPREQWSVYNCADVDANGDYDEDATMISSLG